MPQRIYPALIVVLRSSAFERQASLLFELILLGCDHISQGCNAGFSALHLSMK